MGNSSIPLQGINPGKLLHSSVATDGGNFGKSLIFHAPHQLIVVITIETRGGGHKSSNPNRVGGSQVGVGGGWRLIFINNIIQGGAGLIGWVDLQTK